MRCLLLLACFAGAIQAQSMAEAAAAATGGVAGGVAGKQVSDGITAIFGKVDETAKKAAKPETTKPAVKTPAPQRSYTGTAMMDVGPGVPRGVPDSVPPPPGSGGSHRKRVPVAVAKAEPVTPLLPPPPEFAVTREDLKKVYRGMNREDVLRLGPVSARITMFEEGHLVEMYRYQAQDTTVGRVVLTDGAVSSVEVR
jgi:hypothetical protein